jgi:hypothetical protein
MGQREEEIIIKSIPIIKDVSGLGGELVLFSSRIILA